MVSLKLKIHESTVFCYFFLLNNMKKQELQEKSLKSRVRVSVSGASWSLRGWVLGRTKQIMIPC